MPAESLSSTRDALESQLSARRSREELASVGLVLSDEEIERITVLFRAIDVDGDGTVCFEEFAKASSTLLATSFGLSSAALGRELRSRFEHADKDGNGALCFDEFLGFVTGLSGDTAGPLRAVRARGLAQLLETTLEMTSLSLARELTAASTDGERVTELSTYVDRWCTLDARKNAMGPIEYGADDAGASAERLETMLQEVGTLATDLALTNTTATAVFSLKRSLRLLLGGARASIAFCYRGLRITLGDVIESISMLGRLLAPWHSGGLSGQDVGLIRRTLGDLAKLVPYTIIMIIPMSPPGHVFAFSVLNRVFPGAVPSAFTAQRQDINELYARIAAETSPTGAKRFRFRVARSFVLAYSRKLTQAPVQYASRAIQRLRAATAA